MLLLKGIYEDPVLKWMPNTVSEPPEPSNDIDEEIIFIDVWKSAQKAIDAAKEPDLDSLDDPEGNSFKKLFNQIRQFLRSQLKQDK
jgi:hypothetical protein